MTTKAGERLLDLSHQWEVGGTGVPVSVPGMARSVAAIEAEARAAVLAELRAKVEELPGAYEVQRGRGAPYRDMVDRRAVLALIDEAGKP